MELDETYPLRICAPCRDERDTFRGMRRHEFHDHSHLTGISVDCGGYWLCPDCGLQEDFAMSCPGDTV